MRATESMPKTNKSITKRIKITKRGKMVFSAGGINHFQAKKKRTKQLNNKKPKQINETKRSQVTAYLYH